MDKDDDSIFDGILIDGEFKNPASAAGVLHDCARCDRRCLNAAIVARGGSRSLCLLCAHSLIEEKHYTAETRQASQRRFIAAAPIGTEPHAPSSQDDACDD